MIRNPQAIVMSKSRLKTLNVQVGQTDQGCTG